LDQLVGLGQLLWIFQIECDGALAGIDRDVGGRQAALFRFDGADEVTLGRFKLQNICPELAE
jgi:hypothetical protein